MPGAFSSDGRRTVNGAQLHWHEVNKRKFYTYLPVASIALRLSVYPVNLAKTRLQAETPPGTLPYRSTIDCMRRVARHEGPRALYKGAGVSLISVVVAPVFLTAYEPMRSRLHAAWGENSVAAPFAASLAAACVAQGVIVPVDIVTQHLMVDRAPAQVATVTSAHAHATAAAAAARSRAAASGMTHSLSGRPVGSGARSLGSLATASSPEPAVSRTATQLLRGILAQQGVAGLFRGYWVSLLTYAPTSAITWSTVSAVQPYVDAGLEAAGWAAPRAASAALGRGALSAEAPSQGAVRSIVALGVAGGIAGAASAVLMTPMDVLRARMQLAATPAEGTAPRTIAKLLSEHGARGFFRGCGARVMAMVPSTSMAMILYEVVKRWSMETHYADA